MIGPCQTTSNGLFTSNHRTLICQIKHISLVNANHTTNTASPGNGIAQASDIGNPAAIIGCDSSCIFSCKNRRINFHIPNVATIVGNQPLLCSEADDAIAQTIKSTRIGLFFPSGNSFIILQITSIDIIFKQEIGFQNIKFISTTWSIGAFFCIVLNAIQLLCIADEGIENIMNAMVIFSCCSSSH